MGVRSPFMVRRWKVRDRRKSIWEFRKWDEKEGMGRMRRQGRRS
jgi:hypothetical protein